MVNKSTTGKLLLFSIYCYYHLIGLRRMKNRLFYFLILFIQLTAVGLILPETPTKKGFCCDNFRWINVVQVLESL